MRMAGSLLFPDEGEQVDGRANGSHVAGTWLRQYLNSGVSHVKVSALLLPHTGSFIVVRL